MASVYAGPDGDFRTPWQVWQRLETNNHWTFVLAYNDTILLETPHGTPYLYIGIDETELPAGVTRDGSEIIDTRETTNPPDTVPEPSQDLIR